MQTTTTECSEVIPFPAATADTMPVAPTTVGYANVRFNALKHGILSRHLVLAHEDATEFADLLAALVAEHQPAGPTETHLVEELAGAIWRKRRVLQGEGASINHGLKASACDAERVIPAAAPFEVGMSGKGTDLRDFVTLTPQEVVERQRDAGHDLAATRKALDILARGGSTAYDKALRALQVDSRDWWLEFVSEGEYSEAAEGLKAFIVEHLYSVCLMSEKEARHHDAIKAQTLGDGLQAHRLEKLNRYETHLDRKFERTLAMLLKLKELRRGA